MWPFSLLTRKQTPPPLPEPEPLSADESLRNFDANDYLGEAAQFEREARLAVKEKRYDDAWRLLHLTKQQYGKHAARYGMTRRQTIALDASVHEDLANIRRLEGKHPDALIHLLYCIAKSSRPTQAQEKKLITYFERCGFADATMNDLRVLRSSAEHSASLPEIRNQVTAWHTN